MLPYHNSEILTKFIDVRSPAEYEKDHTPDTTNYPVLTSGERERGIDELAKHFLSDDSNSNIHLSQDLTSTRCSLSR